jgi:hypothetical protein
MYLFLILVLTLEIINCKEYRRDNYDTLHAQTDVWLRNKNLPDITKFFHLQAFNFKYRAVLL